MREETTVAVCMLLKRKTRERRISFEETERKERIEKEREKKVGLKGRGQANEQSRKKLITNCQKKREENERRKRKKTKEENERRNVAKSPENEREGKENRFFFSLSLSV